MEKKTMKPIPTSLLIGMAILIIGGVLFFQQMQFTAILCFVLAGIVVAIDVILLPCSTLFLKEKVNQKEMERYKNFASFYLQDRRLKYSKATFEEALERGWFDIVTMCLLLGVKSGYNVKEKEKLLGDALKGDQRKIFEVLLKGGFSGNFLTSDHGDHFLFDTLVQKNPFYLQCLLKQQIDPNQKNHEGDTPLFVVIKNDAMEHLELLLKQNVSLKIENREGLTPIFFALKEGKLAACEKILAAVGKDKEAHTVTFKRLREPLLVNPLPIKDEDEVLLELIASKDDTTLGLLKRYFSERGNFFMAMHSEVELYVRLSVVEGTTVRKEVVTEGLQGIYTEEECKKVLVNHINKKYRFGRIKDFHIDSIYKTPRCIDSYKVKCEICDGTGQVACSKCSGVGDLKCPKCNGTGEMTCPRCEGTEKVACEKIQRYLECKTCKDGMFTCIKCNDECKQPCPSCEGHGTQKCTCPTEKRTKCPHCDRGYISVQGGMYKKCKYCNNGIICTLCNNTGWVDKRFKSKGYACKECNGQGVITCQVCKGQKRVRCSKRFEEDCTCNKGRVMCDQCQGTGRMLCGVCQGSKKEKCTQCVDGYFFTNVHIDFKAHQTLVNEKIISKNEECITGELLRYIVDEACTDHPYINEVFSLLKIDLKPRDVVIRSNALQKQVDELIRLKNGKSTVDVMDIIPLHYTLVTFKERDGTTFESTLINNHFYRTTKK